MYILHNKIKILLLTSSVLAILVIFFMYFMIATQSISNLSSADIEKIRVYKGVMQTAYVFAFFVSFAGFLLALIKKERFYFLLNTIFLLYITPLIVGMVYYHLAFVGLFHAGVLPMGHIVNYSSTIVTFVLIPVLLIALFSASVVPKSQYGNSIIVRTLYYSCAIILSFVIYTYWNLQTHGIESQWLVHHFRRIFPLEVFYTISTLIILLTTSLFAVTGKLKNEYGRTSHFWFVLIFIAVTLLILNYGKVLSIALSQ